jgi:hypothetical protein
LRVLVQVVILRVPQCETKLDGGIPGIVIHDLAKVTGYSTKMLPDKYLVIIEDFHA